MNQPTLTPKLWSIAAIAQLLVAHNALATLNTHHAVILAQRMRLCEVTQGTVLFEAGATNTDFMAFVLEGDATVETGGAGTADGVVLSDAGPGDILGEMGVVANIPRSATVTATSAMVVAIMDQSVFAQLIKDAPDLACAFLSTLLQSVSSRLRKSNHKLKTLTIINNSLFEELEASQQNESDLAELFVSNSTFGRLPAS